MRIEKYYISGEILSQTTERSIEYNNIENDYFGRRRKTVVVVVATVILIIIILCPLISHNLLLMFCRIDVIAPPDNAHATPINSFRIGSGDRGVHINII